MFIVITYDVCTTDADGRKRLARVAKVCQNFGQRVQNSVFECVVDHTQFLRLKHDLQALIDLQSDNLRFYNLGEKYRNKVEHFGTNPSYDVEGPLIL